jgi:hypothetical protein
MNTPIIITIISIGVASGGEGGIFNPEGIEKTYFAWGLGQNTNN